MTGTPTQSALALFDHQGEQSVERTVLIKDNYSSPLKMNAVISCRFQIQRLWIIRLNLTPEIPGGQDSFLQRLWHSLSHEHTPEHQPQPMNFGAVRHMAQVRKC